MVATLQTLRQHGYVRTESHRPSAGDLWERRKAGRLLRALDSYEDLAAASEGPQDSLRIRFADRYQELIGVPPVARHALRERLTNWHLGQTLADVIESVRAEVHENGSAVELESFS